MIDAKELHIGAHVLVKGVRARVVGIKDITAEEGKPLYQINAAGSPYGWRTFIFVMSNSDEIEPIPITPGLLEELGFEKINEHGVCSVWKHGDIQIAIYGERVELYIYNHTHVSSIHYLHEIESIVYLTTKQEIIKDCDEARLNHK